MRKGLLLLGGYGGRWRNGQRNEDQLAGVLLGQEVLLGPARRWPGDRFWIYDGPNLVAFKVPKSVLEGFVVLKGAAGTKQLQRLGNLLTADNVKCSIDGARTESRDESAPRTAT